MKKRTRYVTALCVLVCAFLALGPATRAKGGKPKTARPKSGGQYKRLHRVLITKLAAGDADAAIKGAEALLKGIPDDLESLYVLAVAHAQKKEIEVAMTYVARAVEGGLPLERFHAGPRDLLAPLTGSDAFKDFAGKHPVALLHGPMLGTVTDTSAKFWVRTVAEARVRVTVATARGAEAARSPVVKTSADRDFTAIAEVKGLKPDTTYDYVVSVGRKPAHEKPFRFRTFPPAGAKAKFQVAFGGGAGYTPKYERMWITLSGRKPLAMLQLGDNVYIDTPKTPQTQRYCYYRRRSRPEYRRFAAGAPQYAIYDDHDFGTNDCAAGPAIDDPPWKRPVWRVFRENWVNPGWGGGEKQPGCWFDFSIGDVDFFMLDCRYYRDLKGAPPSMIGPAQKKWFFERLKASRGTFRVLCSSVPWACGTKGGSKDTWDGFAAERKEVFDFLAANKIAGAVLLSADRHRSDVWPVKRESGYQLYEFESSRLTNVHTHRAVKGSLFSYNKKCSFGLLTFDTTVADPSVTYEIINIDNEVVHTFTLKKSQLTGK